jgi:D-glycero-D-manno-heptose 1,7-bisphosphate phosphatase
LNVEHVLMDRDGVLNVEDPGGGFVLSPEEFVWIDGALAAVAAMRAAGLRLSVVTNQSALGRGLLDPATLERIHDRIRREAAIEAIYYCPHGPDDGCDCRKPAPGLLLRAMADSGIPSRSTIFVGDSARDVEAARAAGITPYLVRTGKGRRTEAELGEAIPTYEDIGAVANALLASR